MDNCHLFQSIVAYKSPFDLAIHRYICCLSHRASSSVTELKHHVQPPILERYILYIPILERYILYTPILERYIYTVIGPEF